jgi:hypothetical protein
LTIPDSLTADLASSLAAITLGHATREYPNKPDHIVTGPADVRSQRDQHPIFYGSLDWHGCVLAYWLLARIYRCFPDHAAVPQIRALFDAHLTAANVNGELAYLAQPLRATFERPYGWGWLLKLAAELARLTSEEGRRWCATLAPLAEAFERRFLDFLPKATYPVRTGVHANTAFALGFAMEHAEAAQRGTLAEVIRGKARHWYGKDEGCQVWEPGGEDFLSPALVEVECMRRVLPLADFLDWLGRFLPKLGAGEPAALFHPVEVSDRTDGKIAHLDGLNLSRAWCLRSLVRSLPPHDARAPVLLRAADLHLRASLPHLDDDYMGGHWLAAYATLALEAG